MNAYELADYMDDNIDAYYASEQKHLDNAANMLRQQADRIAELEKQVNLHKNAHHKCVEILQEKQSEPVGLFKEESWGWIQALPTEDNHNLIPLYTTPQTKPLSDDDVEEFEWMLKKYFNYKPDEPAPNLNRIIRIIEDRVRGIK